MAAGAPASAGSAAGGRSVSPRQVIAIILGALALIFIFSNTNDTKVSFLWYDFTASLWIVLLVMFVIGSLVGFMFGRRRYKAR